MPKIILDKERNMEYSLLGARAFRKVTNKSLVSAMQGFEDEENQAGVIWALLIAEDPEVKIETIIPYLKGKTLGLAMKCVKEAFEEVSDPLLKSGPSANSTSI